MIVTKTFAPYVQTQLGRPWFALVTGWPDSSHPALTFGKATKADPLLVELEAQAGDVVKWGQKDLLAGATVNCGWGIVRPNGTISEVDKTEAQAARRRLHPEDAKLSPSKGAPYARGKGRRTPTPAGPAAPKDAMELAARALVQAIGGDPHAPDQVFAVLDGALRTLLTMKPQTPAAPAAPVVFEMPDDDEDPAPVPAATEMGPDGYPLF